MVMVISAILFALRLSAQAAFMQQRDTLTVQMPVAGIRPGTPFLDVPPGAEVILDIGANYGMYFQRMLRENNNTWVVAVEADPDILFGDKFQMHERIIRLPVAVTNSSPGSILSFHNWIAAEYNRDWPNVMGSLSWIKDQKDPRIKQLNISMHLRRSISVSATRLEDILNLIPPDVTIPFVKIDTQGHDHLVVASAGPNVSRVEIFIVETGPRSEQTAKASLYEHQITKRAMTELMNGMDFQLERCWPPEFWDQHEYNCVYARPNKRYPVHADCFTQQRVDELNLKFQSEGFSTNVAELTIVCCDSRLTDIAATARINGWDKAFFLAIQNGPHEIEVTVGRIEQIQQHVCWSIGSRRVKRRSNSSYTRETCCDDEYLTRRPGVAVYR